MPGKTARHLSRRDFLRIVAIGSGAATLWRLGLRTSGEPPAARESRFLMGTVVNLTVIGADRDHARRAIANTFSRMEALEAIFSRFIPGSDISTLNEAGIVSSPHSEFADVLWLAQETSLSTAGAFDITVKPLIDAYESHFRRDGSLPAQGEIAHILGLVDWHKLRVSKPAVRFEKAGMGATLDGIAKGYIMDEAAKVLRQAGYASVLMEAGGDLLALGKRDPDSPWKVGIQAPRTAVGKLLAKIDVTDKAVATSGDYMQPYSPDFENHHIVNPKTGRSSHGLASATVIAPTCWQADALATTLMVLDMHEAAEFLRCTKNVDAILVAKDLKVFSTIDAQTVLSSGG